MLDDFDIPATDSEWSALQREWARSYSEWLKSNVQSADAEEAAACGYVARESAWVTIDWCKGHPEPGCDISDKLWKTAFFVHDLYRALRPAAKEVGMTGTYGFWKHIRPEFIQLAKVDDRLISSGYVRGLANTYIATEWMQNPYLTWVIVDALIYSQLVDYSETILRARYGVGYALFGKRWKAILVRFLTVPLSFTLGWFGPAAFCWWLYPKYPLVSLAVAAAYYLASFYLVFRSLVSRMRHRLRFGKSARQVWAEWIAAVERAYWELRDETIHVPSLRKAVEAGRETGVRWEPQILSLIDSVTEKTPTTWTTRLRT